MLKEIRVSRVLYQILDKVKFILLLIQSIFPQNKGNK